MVQRKVLNKLSIQAENVIKSEKLLVNHLKKPSSSQNLETKNKGADLKKKMKKSGSFRRPELDRLRSASLRKEVQQPGKPPTVVSVTPKKQSPIKALVDPTPNYMKSTTSSDARKDRAQVSPQRPQTFPDGKRSIRRNLMNSKNNSAPGNKPARTLARTSTLKLVRTLTKSPSFKPSRAYTKKHSSAIFCENLDVQKATCSSTMKAYKFPHYLTLSPGATEAEGTSVMKVCPYTYCSLNGHHHEPLPPLKTFLSARRRVLKAQRSIKLGCLSPRRAKPARDIRKEIEAAQVNFDEKPLFEDSPLAQEESAEFFIEIYSKEKEDTYQKNQESIGVTDETKPENEHAVKIPMTNRKDVNFVDMDANDYFSGQHKNGEIPEEVYPPNLGQGITKPDFLNLMYESEAESTPSIQSEEADLETSDMDWEAGKPIQTNHMIDLDKANSVLVDALLDEVVFNSDQTAGDNCGESLPDEIMQESLDVEIASEASFSDEEAIKKPSLIGENKEGSTPEDETSSQHEDVPVQQMWNQEFEDHRDIGSQEFENPNEPSKNTNENINNSIGTQTDSDFEDSGNMSPDLDQVPKRSIGTQTDVEDDLIQTGCFTNKLLEGSMIVDTCDPCSGIEFFSVCQDTDEAMEHTGSAAHEERQVGVITNEGELKKTLIIDCLSATQSICNSDDLESMENDNDGTTKTEESTSLEDQTNSQMAGPPFIGNPDQNIHNIQENNTNDALGTRMKAKPVGSYLNEEQAICRIIKGTSSAIVENNETTEFNPRAPNFLPVNPDPEAEKVDLRHLMLDEDKNTDEWMIDHALQQAVTKLAPARKRKVALLVEAFETVLPIPKHGAHLRHTSTVFPHTRPIQACS